MDVKVMGGWITGYAATRLSLLAFTITTNAASIVASVLGFVAAILVSLIRRNDGHGEAKLLEILAEEQERRIKAEEKIDEFEHKEHKEKS